MRNNKEISLAWSNLIWSLLLCLNVLATIYAIWWGSQPGTTALMNELKTGSRIMGWVCLVIAIVVLFIRALYISEPEMRIFALISLTVTLLFCVAWALVNFVF